MPPVLFTIGYEDHKTPGSLTDVLRAAGVLRLVDVRELPISRRRGFAKRALCAALGEAGITYEHERALRNPKPSRDLYRSGRQAEGERQYLVHLRNGSAAAVDALAPRLDETPTASCASRPTTPCHRALIVREIRSRRPDLRVEHL